MRTAGASLRAGQCPLHRLGHPGVERDALGLGGTLGADELIITRGDDLSERKRLLFERGQCLISLPGGVGTIDELFDAIAGVHVGLSTLPICLVNTDGYYDGVIAQLERAQTDQLLRKPWRELLTVVDTPEEALQLSLIHI